MDNKIYLYRRLFAIGREFLYDAAEDVIRLYIAINYGKEHISELTIPQLKETIEWLYKISDKED